MSFENKTVIIIILGRIWPVFLRVGMCITIRYPRGGEPWRDEDEAAAKAMVGMDVKSYVIFKTSAITQACRFAVDERLSEDDLAEIILDNRERPSPFMLLAVLGTGNCMRLRLTSQRCACCSCRSRGIPTSGPSLPGGNLVVVVVVVVPVVIGVIIGTCFQHVFSACVFSTCFQHVFSARAFELLVGHISLGEPPSRSAPAFDL